MIGDSTLIVILNINQTLYYDQTDTNSTKNKNFNEYI